MRCFACFDSVVLLTSFYELATAATRHERRMRLRRIH